MSLKKQSVNDWKCIYNRSRYDIRSEFAGEALPVFGERCMSAFLTFWLNGCVRIYNALILKDGLGFHFQPVATSHRVPASFTGDDVEDVLTPKACGSHVSVVGFP